MKVYCRFCNALVVEDMELMSPETFKKKYGERCPKCKTKFNNHFILMIERIKKK